MYLPRNLINIAKYGRALKTFFNFIFDLKKAIIYKIFDKLFNMPGR